MKNDIADHFKIEKELRIDQLFDPKSQQNHEII